MIAIKANTGVSEYSINCMLAGDFGAVSVQVAASGSTHKRAFHLNGRYFHFCLLCSNSSTRKNSRHARLLRAGYERPRGHTAKESDEVAPFQLTELHALPLNQAHP
jgi:hypothetical protein